MTNDAKVVLFNLINFLLMYQIIELKKNLQNKEYFLNQFTKTGEKRFLYVNPPLSGRYLNKMIIPAIVLPKRLDCATALTSLDVYSINEQLLGYKPLDIFAPENDNEEKLMMIKWATHIIFPFTLQPLHSIFEHIREVNAFCKISYHIDFNFYELPKDHKLYDIFSSDLILEIIEENMYHSDVVLVDNVGLHRVLLDRLSLLVTERFLGVARDAVNETINITVISERPKLDVVLDNVDYDPETIVFKIPTSVQEIPIIKAPIKPTPIKKVRKKRTVKKKK